MRKFNTKTLLLSSALIAGLVFTTSNQVKADTTDTGDNTNVLQISHNRVTAKLDSQFLVDDPAD